MKKISLLVLSSLVLLLCNNTYAQIVDQEEETTENRDSFYQQSIDRKAKKPFQYPFVREADVAWKLRVWRVVDFREKMNQVFYYPVQEDQGRKNLFTIIDEAAKAGVIKVYEDDEFKKEIDYATVIAGAGRTQNIELTETNLDGEEVVRDSVVTIHMTPEEIKSLRIKEDWFVDKQRSVQDVRILGFSLIYLMDRGDGSAPQPYPLGWIRYEDPEVRNLLANTEVFNPKNDVERRSYDDVFVQRLFSSYVIRVSRTHDNKISDYLTGLDALFESQNIENEIFNREQDMWEY